MANPCWHIEHADGRAWTPHELQDFWDRRWGGLHQGSFATALVDDHGGVMLLGTNGMVYGRFDFLNDMVVVFDV